MTKIRLLRQGSEYAYVNNVSILNIVLSNIFSRQFCLQSIFLRILTVSLRRSLSYRNRFIDLQSKSMDWFLYDRDLRILQGQKSYKRIQNFNLLLKNIYSLYNILHLISLKSHFVLMKIVRPQARVNNGNSRRMCEICSKFITIYTPDGCLRHHVL